MAATFRLAAAALLPDRTAVLASQGVPAGAAVPERVSRLVDDARDRYLALAEPTALIDDAGLALVTEVVQGEGQNEPDAPLPDLLPDAERLALFAVTIGAAISDEISDLFANNDPALGCMLDGVASLAAEQLAVMAGDRWLAELPTGAVSAAARVLPYSPGYCGWHLTGQRRLFQALEPRRIGIDLTDSCLMQPLKSVSGVLVAATAAVHERAVGPFSFCTDCHNQTCRERGDWPSARGGRA